MKPPDHAFAFAVTVSLLLHVLLVWGVIRWEFAKAPQVPAPVMIEMVMTPPPPPPPPIPPPQKPEPVKTKAAVPKPAHQPQPRMSAQATPDLTPPPPPVPGPPQHKMGSAGIPAQMIGALGSGGGRKGVAYAPPDYAEKIKVRVNASIVYPADSKHFLQQCWVQYRLTVDRNGRMLDYKIDNCGDDRLDAAAEAALIKGGPYPPPPDTGASSYEILGAIVFTMH